MPVKVKRFGGLMPVAKERTFAIQDLDASTRQALGDILHRPRIDDVRQRTPDGFTYKFEITGGDQNGEVAVSGADVPPALQKLLP